VVLAVALGTLQEHIKDKPGGPGRRGHSGSGLGGGGRGGDPPQRAAHATGHKRAFDDIGARGYPIARAGAGADRGPAVVRYGVQHSGGPLAGARRAAAPAREAATVTACHHATTGPLHVTHMVPAPAPAPAPPPHHGRPSADAGPWGRSLGPGHCHPWALALASALAPFLPASLRQGAHGDTARAPRAGALATPPPAALRGASESPDPAPESMGTGERSDRRQRTGSALPCASAPRVGRAFPCKHHPAPVSLAAQAGAARAQLLTVTPAQQLALELEAFVQSGLSIAAYDEYVFGRVDDQEEGSAQAGGAEAGSEAGQARSRACLPGSPGPPTEEPVLRQALQSTDAHAMYERAVWEDAAASAAYSQWEGDGEVCSEDGNDAF
jgi:hypothetical protein